MNRKLTRRTLLKAAALTGTTLLGVAGCAAPTPTPKPPAQSTAPATQPTAPAGPTPTARPAATQPTAAPQRKLTLRIAWWGNESRHKKYKAILDLYEKINPGITMEREFAETGYWERLATQVASGNAPDLIHQHQNMINEYVNRGAMLPLDELVAAKKIDLSDFPKGTIEAGKRGGKNWMIALGASAPSVLFNTPMLQKTGVKMPTNTWTWKDFEETVQAAAVSLGPKILGCTDAGTYEDGLQVYMRQRGFELFKGKDLKEVGFTKEALTDWWSIWDRLRKAKAIPDAALSAEFATASHADSMLAKKLVAMHPMSVNQLQIFQQYIDDELDVVVVPRGNQPGSPPGDFIGTAWLSIYSKTKYIDECAAFISWFVNDPEPAKIFMAEHGPPGSKKIVEMLKPMLPKPVQKGFDFISHIASGAVGAGERPTQGGEVIKALFRLYQEVAFGRMTIAQGVDSFFQEAGKILAS